MPFLSQTTHMDFMVAAANLYGQTYGIKGACDRASVGALLAGVRVPAFAPKSSVKIHVSDEEMEEDKGKDVGKWTQMSPSGTEDR